MSYYDRDRGRYSASDRGRRPMDLSCKVYVGELPQRADARELETVFGYYGPLRNVWVARNPPGFAFIEYEDPRDARDAVRGEDGRSFCGRRIRVELSHGRSRPKKFDERRRDDDRRDRRRTRSRSRSRNRSLDRRSRIRSGSACKSESSPPKNRSRSHDKISGDDD